MPGNLKRYYGSGDLHFITCSCYQRKALLGTPERRDLFLSVLEEVRRQWRFVVLGYVVMPEHFHLLMSEPQQGTSSDVMHLLKLRFARRVPALRVTSEGAIQRVWQRRFYDFNVWTERKRIEKLRYIHRNPVTRGLISAPDQWLWSSFRSYAYGEAGLVRINDCQVLEMKMRPPAA